MTVANTSDESKEACFSIRRGILDNAPRKLIIAPDFIQFEDKDAIAALPARFDQNEIMGYRYGIKWIRGLEFIIGREYRIFIGNQEGKSIKISFASYYGIKKREYGDLYQSILEKLRAFYLTNTANDLIRRFRNNEKIKIGSVSLERNGVTLQSGGLLKPSNITIPWNEVGTRNYYTNFTIYSLKNPLDINRNYNYLEEWNTDVLYRVMRTILYQRNN